MICFVCVMFQVLINKVFVSLVIFQKYYTEIKDLQHLGELGNGTCGHVVKMQHKPSQKVIAVKVSVICVVINMAKLY